MGISRSYCLSIPSPSCLLTFLLPYGNLWVAFSGCLMFCCLGLPPPGCPFCVCLSAGCILDSQGSLHLSCLSSSCTSCWRLKADSALRKSRYRNLRPKLKYWNFILRHNFFLGPLCTILPLFGALCLRVELCRCQTAGAARGGRLFSASATPPENVRASIDFT